MPSTTPLLALKLVFHATVTATSVSMATSVTTVGRIPNRVLINTNFIS